MVVSRENMVKSTVADYKNIIMLSHSDQMFVLVLMYPILIYLKISKL